MISSHETLSVFNIFKLSMEAGEKIDFQIAQPNVLLSSITSASLMLKGSCSLSISGAVYESEGVTPHIRTDVIPSLTGFDTYRRKLNWASAITTTLSSLEPSIYLCVTLAPDGKIPLRYSIIDSNNAVIPQGALFIPTENCSIGNNIYLKHEPYLNEIAELSLQSQLGKVIIVEKE